MGYCNGTGVNGEMASATYSKDRRGVEGLSTWDILRSTHIGSRRRTKGARAGDLPGDDRHALPPNGLPSGSTGGDQDQ